MSSYRRFLAETLVDYDIGAQEPCHRLLKLPLGVCSHNAFPLNVGKKLFKKLQEGNRKASRKTNHYLILYVFKFKEQRGTEDLVFDQFV